MRRFPESRTKHMKTIFAMLSANDMTAAASSGGIGLSYALKIWTINGLIAWTPVNCARKKSTIIIMNGLSVLFRFNSDNFSTNVGNGCEHLIFCLMHKLHDLERSLCRFKSLNSCATASRETQPRSQHKDFSASSTRFFAKSHWGVSGIYKIVCFFFSFINN